MRRAVEVSLAAAVMVVGVGACRPPGPAGQDAAEDLLWEAEAHLAQGEFEEALEVCDQAVDLAPRDARAWLTHGRAALEVGRRTEGDMGDALILEALDNFRLAERLDAEDPEIERWIAECEAETEKRQE
jgi:tetratricopeptide (TPR) repeat protein